MLGPMVRVRLLGPPGIEGDDGGPVALRGHKTWAVLARLVLAERPVPRRELALELFPDAVDPLGALRWCLAGLRKALDAPSALVGDPIDPDLPAHVIVDVTDLIAGHLDPAAPAGELLEGVDPRCGPEFETWLLIARQQVAGQIENDLRTRGVSALARGDHGLALTLAERLVRWAPFDEGGHVLLIRALVEAGRHQAATRHLEAVELRLVQELGVAPSDALRDAARVPIVEVPPGISAATQCATLLDTGRAAVQAGAVDAGVASLRRAVDCAERAGDQRLHAEAALALGTVLVRSVRGRDDEGDVLLEQAALLAGRAGADAIAALARAEQGYLDALAGRRAQAADHLRQARSLTGDDRAVLAAIEAVAGFDIAESGRTDEAVDHYESAVAHAHAAGDGRREAWAVALGAWALLRGGRTDDARGWAREARRCVDALGWTSFSPFVDAVDAELVIVAGPVPGDRPVALERAFAMSCELCDPCWEAVTARALALQAATAGDVDGALRWIAEARVRSQRTTDPWAGLVAHVLLTEAELRHAAGEVAPDAARDALAVAARCGLDGVLPRAVALISGGLAPPVTPAAAAPA